MRHSSSWDSRCSVMSVLVPNQPTTVPLSSWMGVARERNQRYSPEAPRRGKVSSQGSPERRLADSPCTTRSMWSGWCTVFQPSPRMLSKLVPVNAYQRWLYQVASPSSSQVHAS